MNVTIETREDPAPYAGGWPKEIQRMQEMVDVRWEVEDDASYISATLPDQHRKFYQQNIALLPLASKDSQGRVWTSVLTGRDGQPGFAKSPNPRLLSVVAEPPKGDPAWRTLTHGAQDVLVAGVGVELTTRRRNKLSGHADVEWKDKELHLDIAIDEALGNCPKYISVRDLKPHLDFKPTIELESLQLGTEDTLPSAVTTHILESDTLWLGTSYLPAPGNGPSSIRPHLGANHRGGRPGWVRVRSDGRTLVIPDLSGNRHMTSLGNILSDPHAGITMVDFVSGSILYLTGSATNKVGEEATQIMPRAKGVVTLFYITGYTLVRDALPFRQPPGLEHPSPYSPPVRYLAEEQAAVASLPDVKATLQGAEFHQDDLATFTFKTSSPIKVTAGQYAVLDATPLIGAQSYMHMARKGSEALLNDDGVRTWTIAVPPSTASPDTFSLTIRKVEQGRVTPRFFSFGTYLMTKLAEGGGGFVPKMELPLLGIGGTFTLPSTPQDLLLIAGGIGITPSLAFLRELATSSIVTPKVQLLVSTREPQVILELIKRALSDHALPNLTVHLFSSSDTSFDPKADFAVSQAQGRITEQAVQKAVSALTKPRVYLCGPVAFESSVQEHLRAAGIDAAEVETENFNY